MASEYWINREKEKLKAHLGDVTKTEKILHRNLKKASKDIEDEIYKLYSRYSKENRLSYAEANKLLTGPKYKEWRMDLKDYVDEITKTDNKELLLELNTLSAKSSITGLEEQLYQIQKILDRDYIFKHKEVKKLLKAGVKNSFTQTAYTIENLNGFHTSFSMISQKDIEDIIKLPWSGKNYSSRLWANRTKLKDKVQEQIVQATIQGKDLRQCIKDVSETMEATREVTKRLINTEHAYACSQGDLKMYDEFGIDKYEYVATLDSKTSNICRGLDGKVYKRSEAIPGVNFPPTHPHCRSTTVPADVETLGDETRIAKDSKGNYIYLKANTTYEDYIKALETGNWNNIKANDPNKDFIKEKTTKENLLNAQKQAEKLISIAKEKDIVITKDLQNIIDKTNGRLAGLDYRIKSTDSLVRKLMDKSEAKGMSVDEYASKITDILRYTNVSTTKNFTGDYYSIIDNLIKKSYNIVEVTNTLGDINASYRGINCLVSDKDGYIFELQFHTEESLNIKEVNHKLYEELRLKTTNKARQLELYKEMQKKSTEIPMPPDITKIKNKKVII